MASRTWYVSCSPRSPEKIKPELEQLATLEGESWSERDEEGNIITQIKFANLLKNIPTFEGSISEKNPDFSARDRFAPMQTYGFAYVDSDRILRITDAGRRLIKGERIQELYLKQMLKWQYPSYQHGGNTRTRHLYPPAEEMGIHPFIATLRACFELDGLSKTELAIFILPVMRNEDVERSIDKVRKFREERSKLKGIDRREFVCDTHLKEYGIVYVEELETGRFNTRESLTTNEEEFLKKKARNSLDVADAAFRYFRATGLFTFSADYRRLAISRMHQEEVRRILTEMEFEIVDFYDDLEAFYTYMGDPDTPQLPWESQEELAQKAISLGVSRREANRASVTDLKNVIEDKISQYKQRRMEEYMITAQEEEEVKDIIETFERIKQKDVVDPPLFLEWNTWRAFVSMDDCEKPIPNFNLDDDLKPFSTAAGNQADMEIIYDDTFVVLGEVTLSGGARQYDMEGEPVTRHVGRYQKAEVDRESNREVYCLFVAPKINPATRDYFYVHLKHFNNPEFGGFLNMVILNIEQFIEVFQFAKSLDNLDRDVIRDLFERIVDLRDVTNSGQEWGKLIPQTIKEWKEDWAV
ncbi:MAG: AlwI family type II restriction endonuclease [Natronincolaceae bacterium]|jgi:hypothetical protein